MRRNRGFTLIELMITVAIFGILMTMGAQLTTTWVDSAKQRDAENLLRQGISRAKAVALRNPGGVQADCPAVMLSRSGQDLQLFIATDNSTQKGTCTTIGTSAIWQARLPASATFTSNGTTLSCIALNSRALPVTGSSACATGTISVSAGNESAVNVEII